MTQFQILQENQMMPPAERQLVADQIALMNLQDIIVEVTRHFKQMTPNELLAFLDTTAPLLRQELLQLDALPDKSERDKNLAETIQASLKDYADFKATNSLVPQSYQSEAHLLKLLTNVTPVEFQIFFDTVLMSLCPKLATLKRDMSKFELDRLMAVDTLLRLMPISTIKN